MMQDLHSVGVGDSGGGGGGRFYGSDRRLRLLGHSTHQALKCPRCDSLNTKFCYYNNYNLSQPRHFCKACRRYWTKGGVLRSVPVGGGCRKAKRSKTRGGEISKERKSKDQSPSSTDSSTLTAAAATTTTSVTAVAAVEGSAPSANFSGAIFYDANPNPPANTRTDRQPSINPSGAADGRIFSEIGNFDGLMTSSENAASVIGFGIPTTSYDGIPRAQATDVLGAGMVGIGEVDEFKMQDGELTAALDWGGCGGGTGYHSLYGLTAALDPSYWGQPQWTDSDHPLPYLP